MTPAIRDPNYQGPFGNTLLHSVLASRTDEHIEWLLDQALEATFPASDPIAVTPQSA
jgi:hypothetical protein